MAVFTGIPFDDDAGRGLDGFGSATDGRGAALKR